MSEPPVPVPRPSETPLPCPFCERLVNLYVGRNGSVMSSSFAVRCKCGASVVRPTLAEAIERWNRRPSVPTATQDATAESVAAEAKGLLALIRLAAMDGYNPIPVSTVDDWLEECKKRLFVFYLSAKGDALRSSEEAANSDTERLNWLDAEAKRLLKRDPLGLWPHSRPRVVLAAEEVFNAGGDIRKAIDAARVQGENSQ